MEDAAENEVLPPQELPHEEALIEEPNNVEPFREAELAEELAPIIEPQIRRSTRARRPRLIFDI